MIAWLAVAGGAVIGALLRWRTSILFSEPGRLYRSGHWS